MSGTDERRTWPQQRRFEFLEWKLYWEGRIIRSDLETAFAISTPQASVDLRNYRELAPTNMEQTARGYRPTAEFHPQVFTPSADRLLLQLRASLNGVLPRADLWFRDVPPVDIIPDISRPVEAECLRLLLGAIEDRGALNIYYRSLSGARNRVIAPHALAYDGHRWHVRAWCCEKEEFRDFVLSRISNPNLASPVVFDPSDDLEWETKVVLQLRPHSALTSAQREAIQLDYGMTNGRRDIELRAALAFYYIRRMNLDLPCSEQISAERLQIELANLDEVNATIQRAKDKTRAKVTARKSHSS